MERRVGVPINQEDLAGTLLTFSYQAVDTLRRLGAHLQEDEAQAYSHAWLVVGYLLGVSEDLLPVDLADAAGLMAAIQRRQFAASDEGREMTSALLEMMEERCPGPLFKGVPAAMVHHLVGSETATLIGLESSLLHRIEVLPFMMATKTIATLGGLIHPMGTIAEPFSRALLDNLAEVPRSGGRAPFSIPKSLRESWKLQEPEQIQASTDRFDRLASQQGQRPEALPDRPWMAAQHWEHLLFVHWPLPPETLRPLLPAGLELETFDGSAWLSVVAMRLDRAHFRHLPPLSLGSLSGQMNLSDFPELNLRTYVSANGRPGIIFLSLDTSSLIAVELCRRLFHLPYMHGELNLATDDPWIEFSSRRTQHGAPPASFSGRYRPVGDQLEVEPGSLDHFLTERYRMYTAGSHGELHVGEVHHAPWVLQEAEAEIQTNTMGDTLGLQLEPAPPLLRYARQTDVLVWSMERVRQNSSPEIGEEEAGATQ